jgi:hypothetical protein
MATTKKPSTGKTARKTSRKPAGRPPTAAETARLELQATPAWIAQVDAAAAALGLSRAAYVRMAVSKQMNADRKEG